MTVLDKIKLLFKRAKPVVEVAEEKLPEATMEKPAKTTKPQKKAIGATKKKATRAKKRKRGG